MFGRGIKNITIDSNKSHIFLKDTEFSLIIIRPYDLVQLGDLVGSSSEDILIWTGKTIGKALLKNILEKKKVKNRKKMFEELLTNLTNLGYGKFRMDYSEGERAKIEITNSIVEEIDEKDDAQLICNLYNGIFIGSFSTAGIDVEVKKSICPFQNENIMTFEYDFISQEEELK